MQLYKKRVGSVVRGGGREGGAVKDEIQTRVFSVGESLPSLCNRGNSKSISDICIKKKKKRRMIVIIRVLSKRKMSFYNSVHYCQGNAGILDLYSTLSVRV